MDNNIFKFATKELSQDAFLCWCINWVNQTSNSVLYDLGADVLKTMLFNELYKNKLKELKNDLERANVHINIIRQFNITTYDNKKENKNRMDIVLTIKAKKENYVVIIEDKIDATVDIDEKKNDQLERYKEAMQEIFDSINNKDKNKNKNKDKDKEKEDRKYKTNINKLELLGLSKEDCKNTKIIPVLVKTGELTAYEKNLGCRIVDASKLLNVIEKYIELVDSDYRIFIKDFCENLKEKVDINNTEKYIDIVNKGELLEGEKFAKKMTLYNCFYKYFGIIHRIGKVKNKFKDITEIGEKKYEIYKNNKGVTQKGGSTFKKGSNVMIWTPKFVNYSDTWKNTYFESDGKIKEVYTGTGIYKKLDNDIPKIRYTFKYDRDAFGKEYYTFIGLYVLDSDNEEIKSRVWKKVTHNTHPDLVFEDGAVTLNIDIVKNIK